MTSGRFRKRALESWDRNLYLCRITWKSKQTNKSGCTRTLLIYQTSLSSVNCSIDFPLGRICTFLIFVKLCPSFSLFPPPTWVIVPVFWLISCFLTVSFLEPQREAGNLFLKHTWGLSWLTKQVSSLEFLW